MKKTTLKILATCLLCSVTLSVAACTGSEESISNNASSNIENSISENKTQSHLETSDLKDSSTIEKASSLEESSSEDSLSEDSFLEESSLEDSSSEESSSKDSFIEESSIEESSSEESSLEDSSIEESSSAESSSEDSSIEESSSAESSSEDSSIEESSSEESSSDDSSSKESSEEKEPVRHYPYEIGDDVEDFSLTLSDGSTFTLSEALQENKIVIIKFWATWCTPCVMEWGAMSEAFYEYQDDVLILCLSLTDSNEEIAEYKHEKNLPFAMAADSIGLNSEFGVGAIPHKFVIDQNGVLVESKLGAVTDVSEYLELFERYCAE